jgi:hypothetical protein
MKKWNTSKILFDKDKNEIANFLFNVQTLNAKDLVLDETEFDIDGSQLHRYVFRYNNNGKLTERFEYDSINELIERTSFELNEYDEVVKIVTEFGDGEKVIKDFEFINNDRTEKVTIRNSENEIIGYEIYENDGEGNIIEEIEITGGIEVSRYQKVYEHDKLIEESLYLNSEFEYKDMFIYKNELLSQRKRLDFDSILIESEKNEYNSNGKLLKKTYFNNKEKYEIIETNEYDSKGNVISTKAETNGRLVFRNDYTYDNIGAVMTQEILEIDWNGYILKNEKTINEVIYE